ncbi:unnamed protein product [Brachionus calyciflorus]|uniref:ATP-dependent DNA helicase n=1 Tax=Brachionus calyciflorus TaxID=104777 RepID=A0A814EGU7_9BILA|nr:unnamed protein product [Brachionus calyciflorus]
MFRRTVSSEEKKRYLINCNGFYKLRVAHPHISHVQSSLVAENSNNSFIYNHKSYFVEKGIRNYGNTCFIGSVLQCLNSLERTFIPTLISVYEDLEPIMYNNKYNLLKAYVNWLYNGFNVIKVNKKLGFEQLEKNFFREIFLETKLQKIFQKGQQQDPHEFMLYFFEYLDDCRKESEMIKTGIDQNNDFDIYFRNFRINEPTFSQSMFGVKYLISSKCITCNYLSSRNDPFDGTNGQGEKIISYISFPRYLNIAPWKGDFDGYSYYILNAICLHGGESINAAIVWSKLERCWKLFNDQTVTIIEEDIDDYIKGIQNEFQPYILFYAKSQSDNLEEIIDEIEGTDDEAFSDEDIVSANNELINKNHKKNDFITCSGLPDKNKNISSVTIEEMNRKKIRSFTQCSIMEIGSVEGTDLVYTDEATAPSDSYSKLTAKGRPKKVSIEEKKSLRRQYMKDYMKEYRKSDNIREKKTEYQQKYRENSINRSIEREDDRMRRDKSRNTFQKTIENYEQGILNGPTIICICCGGLFFRRSVIEFLEKICKKPILNEIYYLKNKKSDNKLWICITCNRYMKNGRTPRLALSRGLDFPLIPNELIDLNELEERLCSPRLPFIRVKDLFAWDKQKKITGNVVNVPIDNQETLKTLLPRKFGDSETIQLKLMRRTDYTNAYMEDKINPARVVRAFNYLKDQSVFRSNNISFDQTWLNTYGNSNTNRYFIVNPNEDLEDVNYVESLNDDQLLNKAYDEYFENSSTQNEHIPANQLAQQKDVVSNKDEIGSKFAGSNDDLANEPTTIAPAEGLRPVSLVSDKDADELTFVKIYCGRKFRYNGEKFTYGARCKSEFRHFDRRCAQNFTKIFFSYKKLVSKKLSNAIDICLRKSNKDMTAREALDKNYINDLVLKNEANLLLRTVRSSPQYWQWKKMEVNAAIRQLGCPTFFITLSPAEIDWPELIVILVLTVDRKKISIEEAKKMSRSKRIDYVSKDPITVARYFENRMGELVKLIINKNGPFRDNKVIDYFWRIEFQYRGSPHIHMLTWNQNAPLYERNDNQRTKEENKLKCIDFIDKYITCNRPINGLLVEEDYDNRKEHVPLRTFDLDDYQIHKCKDNCETFDKDKNKICKYGFPLPILDRTIILEPLNENDDNYSKSKLDYFEIRQRLDEVYNTWRTKGISINLENFLASLNIDFDAYLLALRSSITRNTVFLVRTCKEIRLNQYNQEIAIRHSANMDIQYIMDPYGAAAYVTSYMMKANEKMSILLKKAIETLDDGGITTRQRLARIANKFTNCSEIGAQECAFTLLSMPVTRLSRETIYINTYPSSDRNYIIKEDRYLELMNPESRAIYKGGLLRHYRKRPKDGKEGGKYTNMCLAEFASFYDYFSSENYQKLFNKDKMNKFVVDEDDIDDDMNEINFENEELADILKDNDRNDEIIMLEQPFADEVIFNDENDKDIENYDEELNKIVCKLNSQKNRLANVSASKKRFILNSPTSPTETMQNLDISDKDLTISGATHNGTINDFHSPDPFPRTSQLSFNLDAGNEIPNQEISQELSNKYNKPLSVSDFIRLRDRDGYIKRRSRQRILRYKKYSINKDPINYMRVQMMLYCPWFNEELQVEVPDIPGRYEKYKLIIAENRSKFEGVLTEKFDKIQEMVENDLRMYYERLFEEEAERENEANEFLLNHHVRLENHLGRFIEEHENEDGIFSDPITTHERLESVFGFQGPFYDQQYTTGQNNQDHNALIVPSHLNQQEYVNLMISLNRKQHMFMVNFLANMRDNVQSMLYVYGPAGTGKSHLIKALYHTCVRIFNPNLERDKLTCVLTAYTGKAAYNINGPTIHSLFHIPLDFRKMNLLTGENLVQFKKQMKTLKLVIIDEISMVGRSFLKCIHSRLAQATGLNELFGGVSVICLGDFNQLRPMCDSWIFDGIKSSVSFSRKNYDAIGESLLWSVFEFFELDEIMRQRDDQRFSEALRSIGDYNTLTLNNEQIQMFNNRFVENLDNLPSNCIVLCYENDKVDQHNRRVISQLGGEPAVKCIAKDIPNGANKDSVPAKNLANSIKYKNDIYKTMGMPNEILLKVGVKYMITVNLKQNDGLVNGCVGILRKILMNDKFPKDDRPCVKRVYLEFPQRTTGLLTRQERTTISLARKDGVNNAAQTLLQLKQQTVERGLNYTADRIQFPIIECEAMTIHKSQGQTYDCICVDIGHEGLPRDLLYVGLSRVTSMNGLYLYSANPNQQSILTKDIRNMTREQRQAKKDEMDKKDKIRLEMTRLRTKCALKNKYPFLEITGMQIERNNLESSNHSIVNIIFMNIQNLNGNLSKIRNDFAFKNSDLIFLVECHNSIERRGDVERVYGELFSCVHFSSCQQHNASNGQVCYVRNQKHFNKLAFIDDNCDLAFNQYHNKHKICEFSLFIYKYNPQKILYIISIYKHHDMDNNDFLNVFDMFLDKNMINTFDQSILLLGDFNIDFNKNQTIMNELNKRDFKPIFRNSVTFDRNSSQIDWAFTNTNFQFNIPKSQTYRTWFSDHHGIYTQIDFGS